MHTRFTIHIHTLLLMFILLCVPCLGQDVVSTRDQIEKLGLSETEWAYFMDSRMSMEKLKQLLALGISLPEYFSYPWVVGNMTEREWIKRRRSGEFFNPADRPVLDDPDRSIEVSEWAVVHNFFVPGLNQFKRHQYPKAATMLGVAVCSGGLSALLSLNKGSFEWWPMLILCSDMLWSSVDIGVQIYKTDNPDASRFSTNDQGVRILLTSNW